MSLEKIYRYSCLLTLLLVVGYTISPMVNFHDKSILVVNGFTEQIHPNSYLIQSNPVHIYNDSGFSIFPGSGTEQDPYRLENLNISSNTQTCGINISDTTNFFIIRNCFQ